MNFQLKAPLFRDTIADEKMGKNVNVCKYNTESLRKDLKDISGWLWLLRCHDAGIRWQLCLIKFLKAATERPFGPKGDFAGLTDGRTDERTTGLRELDISLYYRRSVYVTKNLDLRTWRTFLGIMGPWGASLPVGRHTSDYNSYTIRQFKAETLPTPLRPVM